MKVQSTSRSRSMAAALNASTPTVSGLYRSLTLLRSNHTPDAPSRLLTHRTVVDPLARTTQLFGARPLINDATSNADAMAVLTLNGQPLMLHTADGDASLELGDVQGRPLWSRNAQNTVTVRLYEPSVAGGRPLAFIEAAAGNASVRVREQYFYTPAEEPEWKGLNLSGRLTQTYHNAGINRILSSSLTEQPLATEERLLKLEVDLPDWSRATEADTEAPLRVFSKFDATGAILSVTNAVQVTTINVYDLSGVRAQTRLSYIQRGKLEEVITLHGVRYDANAFVLVQTAGNGIVDTFGYDPRSRYLTRHFTARPAGHSHGNLIVSDLHYDYDPAGNILNLDDQGADPSWHNNQGVTGFRKYTYDTLDRLTSATGRERLPASRHHPLSGVRSEPSAGNVWGPYAQEYHYDDGNNLFLIRHHNKEGHSARELIVANNSNRAILKINDIAPDAAFFAGGLQKQLADGRLLNWYADNQLKLVKLVCRQDAPDDTERYQYADGSTRVRKIHTAQTGAGTKITVTTYSRNLEVRQRLLLGVAKQHKHIVITTVDGVRLVHDLHLEHVQLRYSFGDHLNSCGVEADATGNLLSREEYAPYGGTVGADEAAIDLGNLTQRTMRHADKERDATGLYYYGWRYCQPELGRWLSADPGGLVDGINLFRMVRNSPLRLYDFKGQNSVDFNKLIEQKAEAYSATDAVMSRLKKRTENDCCMGEEMAHSVQDDGYTVISTYRDGPAKYWFENQFRRHVWVLDKNFRNPDKKTFASTVVLHQYKIIAGEKKFYGELPKVILRWHVVNEYALDAINLTEEEEHLPSDQREQLLAKRFLKSPGNGKHTQRLLDALGMEATHVEVHRGVKDPEVRKEFTVIAVHVRPTDKYGSLRSLTESIGNTGSVTQLQEKSRLIDRQGGSSWLSKRLIGVRRYLSARVFQFRNYRAHAI